MIWNKIANAITRIYWVFSGGIGQIWNRIIFVIGKTRWGFSGGLTKEELNTIRTYLIPNYYIILTRRNNHLSTFFENLADFVLTGKWGFWAHAMVNCEDEVSTDNDFRIVEATNSGTHYSTFEEAFMVHSVALLKPRSMSIERWTTVLDKLKTDIGKPYDTLFNISQDKALSCVELIRDGLMAEPNYSTDFAAFEAMIKKYKNKLTPNMFFNCPDFEVVYTVIHSGHCFK